MKRSNLVPPFLMLTGLTTAIYATLKMSSMRSLNGQVVLITGSSRGLGFQLAREFAAQGCKVVMCARVQEELDKAQAQFEDWNIEVFSLVCDVSDQSQVNGMVEAVMERYGHVDILVNNAGTIQVGPIQSATLEDFEQAMDTMFWGGIHTILAFLPQMQARKSGHIVNITSIGGKVSVPHLLPYVAAKFAMTGFSEGLTAELMGSGVRVTTIIPGLMRTGSYLNAFFKGHQQDEFRWFGIGDNLPFISIDGQKAAKTIVQAVRRGETEYVLTIPAKGLTRFYGLLPNVAIPLIGVMSQLLLPSATDNAVKERGMEIQVRMREAVFNWITKRGRSAAQEFNQYTAPSFKGPYHVEASSDR